MRIVTRATEWKAGYREALVDFEYLLVEALLEVVQLSKHFEPDSAEAMRLAADMIADKINSHDFEKADL